MSWVAWFALDDLSFQQPTVVVAVAPVQADDASSVAGSAPSSQRLTAEPDSTVAG